MHDVDLLLTLTGALTAALVLGFATQRLRLSPIVGYLLAGIVVGPFTPGFVAHGSIAQQLAEIGVILLMFGVGLNFDVHELLAVRKVAIPGALAGIAIATIVGTIVSRVFGWSLGAGFIFGLTISIASTVVLLRVLSDRDALHTHAGHLAVGWLVVEDLFTVLMLVLLPVLAGGGSRGRSEVAIAIGLALLKIGGLIVFTFTVARRLLPKILGYVAKTRSRDLFTLTVLVVALGIAVGSAKLFGVSMALGAFLAGMVVGQSEFSSRAASEAIPMRDAFAVLFFVSVGMLCDPRQLIANAPLVLATLGVILLGKPLVAYAMMRRLRETPQTSVTVAASLAQIGEFSFIVAAMGRQVGVLPERATQVLVVASIVSITLNPLLVRAATPVARRLSLQLPPLQPHERPSAIPAPGPQRAIVVGYGPVGQTVTRLLRENAFHPTVIELNHETVIALTREGIRAIYGDASQREILERAGVRDAGSLIFAASGSPAEAVVRMAKDLNPNVRVLTRSTYVRDVASAKRAGAHFVVAAEAEVALAMTEHLLTQLGATAEQLDRARERVRRDLAGDGGVRE